MIRLTVREGGTTRTIRREADRLVLGTDPEGVVLAGAGISPRHCVVQAGRDGGAVVLDLGSREGTILRARRITRGTLEPGDVLTLGSVAVVVEEWRRTAPASAADGAPGGAAPAPAPDSLRTAAARGEVPREESFEEALFLAVRRSPPLLGSLAFHGAVALLLFLATPELPRGGGGRGSLQVFTAGMDLPGREEDAPREAPAPPARDDALLPTLPESTPDVLAGVDPVPRDSPFAASTETFSLPEDRNASNLGFGSGPRRDNRDNASAPVSFQGNPAFEGGQSVDLNRRAADLLAESLGGAARLDRRLSGLADGSRVLVVRGVYDHAEKVLGLLDQSHRVVSVEDLELLTLDADGFILFACGDEEPSAESVQHLRAFVEAGGFLCTTDWALESVVLRAFPGKLRSLHAGKKGIATRNEQVTFRLPSPAHPLVRGLREAEDGARWWIEDSAYPLEVVDTKGVTVLVESEEFRRRYRSGLLAVHFKVGKGEVLHLVGHVWQKEGNLKGAFGMQRILVNFLLRRAATIRPATDGEDGNAPAAVVTPEKR